MLGTRKKELLAGWLILAYYTISYTTQTTTSLMLYKILLPHRRAFSGIRIDYHTLRASKGIFACSTHSRNVVASSMQRRQSGLLANLSSSSGRKMRACGRSQFTGQTFSHKAFTAKLSVLKYCAK